MSLERDKGKEETLVIKRDKDQYVQYGGILKASLFKSRCKGLMVVLWSLHRTLQFFAEMAPFSSLQL